MLVLCNFLRKLMVSNIKIHRALRTHTTLIQLSWNFSFSPFTKTVLWLYKYQAWIRSRWVTITFIKLLVINNNMCALPQLPFIFFLSVPSLSCVQSFDWLWDANCHHACTNTDKSISSINAHLKLLGPHLLNLQAWTSIQIMHIREVVIFSKN